MSFDVPDWGDTDAFSYHFDLPVDIPLAITGGSKKRKEEENTPVQKKQKLSNGNEMQTSSNEAQENSAITKTKKKKKKGTAESITETAVIPNENGVSHKKNKNKYKEINKEQKRRKMENGDGIKWHPSRCIPDVAIEDKKVSNNLELEEKNGGMEEPLKGKKKKRKIDEVNVDIKNEDAGFILQDEKANILNSAGLTNGTLQAIPKVENGEMPSKIKKQKKKDEKALENSVIEKDTALAGPTRESDLNTKKQKKKGKKASEKSAVLNVTEDLQEIPEATNGATMSKTKKQKKSDRKALEENTLSKEITTESNLNESFQEIPEVGNEEISVKTKKKKKKKKVVEGNTVPAELNRESNLNESLQNPDAGSKETLKKTKKQKKMEAKGLGKTSESIGHTVESGLNGNVQEIPEATGRETLGKSKKQKKKMKALDISITDVKDNSSIKIESTIENSSKEDNKKPDKIKAKTKKNTNNPLNKEKATTSKGESDTQKGKKKKKKNQKKMNDAEEEKEFQEKDPQFTSDLDSLLKELDFDQFDMKDFEEEDDDDHDDVAREVEDLSESEMSDYEEEGQNEGRAEKEEDDGDIADDESDEEVKGKKNKLEKKKEANPEPSPGSKKLDKKILLGMLEKNEKLETTKPEPKKEKPKLSAAEALKQKMIVQLNAARFRMVNEELYTTTSEKAKAMFKRDPEAFKSYHVGYQNQVEQWPINPLNVIITWLKKQPKDWIIADFGCGDAKLSMSVPQTKVHSFDLVAANNRVTACDMAHTPLKPGSVDVVVFCLSLMGTNIKDFIIEANRVLKKGGIMKVAEVESRFTNLNDFLLNVSRLGFHCTQKDVQQKYFYMFDFKKNRDCKKAKDVPEIALKPCMYKKR